ncbi:hypothetical protein LCGC14_2836360, partial [marine sediment metagenome]
ILIGAISFLQFCEWRKENQKIAGLERMKDITKQMMGGIDSKTFKLIGPDTHTIRSTEVEERVDNILTTISDFL